MSTVIQFYSGLMLIGMTIFILTSYHHFKRLHSQTVSVLSSSVQHWMDDLLKQIHAPSLQLSSSSSFKALADSKNMEAESFSLLRMEVQDGLNWFSLQRS